MKKIYNQPTLEVIKFDAEDIITTSNTTPGMDENGNIVDENGNLI